MLRMSVAGYMQLRELTAVLALPPSLAGSPFDEQTLLKADKALVCHMLHIFITARCYIRLTRHRQVQQTCI